MRGINIIEIELFEGGIQERDTLNQEDFSGNMREFAEHRDSHILSSFLLGIARIHYNVLQYFVFIRYAFRGSLR